MYSRQTLFCLRSTNQIKAHVMLVLASSIGTSLRGAVAPAPNALGDAGAAHIVEIGTRGGTA